MKATEHTDQRDRNCYETGLSGLAFPKEEEACESGNEGQLPVP